jgi:hypothetical protein
MVIAVKSNSDKGKPNSAWHHVLQQCYLTNLRVEVSGQAVAVPCSVEPLDTLT